MEKEKYITPWKNGSTCFDLLPYMICQNRIYLKKKGNVRVWLQKVNFLSWFQWDRVNPLLGVRAFDIEELVLGRDDSFVAKDFTYKSTNKISLDLEHTTPK